MDHLPHLVLLAVHDLARADLPADAGSIARVVGRSATECAAALVHLDERGLCDASRARLTMRGLVAAASLRAAVRGSTIARDGSNGVAAPRLAAARNQSMPG